MDTVSCPSCNATTTTYHKETIKVYFNVSKQSTAFKGTIHAHGFTNANLIPCFNLRDAFIILGIARDE